MHLHVAPKGIGAGHGHRDDAVAAGLADVEAGPAEDLFNGQRLRRHGERPVRVRAGIDLGHRCGAFERVELELDGMEVAGDVEIAVHPIGDAAAAAEGHGGRLGDPERRLVDDHVDVDLRKQGARALLVPDAAGPAIGACPGQAGDPVQLAADAVANGAARRQLRIAAVDVDAQLFMLGIERKAQRFRFVEAAGITRMEFGDLRLRRPSGAVLGAGRIDYRTNVIQR